MTPPKMVCVGVSRRAKWGVDPPKMVRVGCHAGCPIFDSDTTKMVTSPRHHRATVPRTSALRHTRGRRLLRTMGVPGRRTQSPSLKCSGRIHARDVMPAVDGTHAPPREACAVSTAMAGLCLPATLRYEQSRRCEAPVGDHALMRVRPAQRPSLLAPCVRRSRVARFGRGKHARQPALWERRRRRVGGGLGKAHLKPRPSPVGRSARGLGGSTAFSPLGCERTIGCLRSLCLDIGWTKAMRAGSGLVPPPPATANGRDAWGRPSARVDEERLSWRRPRRLPRARPTSRAWQRAARSCGPRSGPGTARRCRRVG